LLDALVIHLLWVSENNGPQDGLSQKWQKSKHVFFGSRVVKF
jgi:hypothetical protein